MEYLHWLKSHSKTRQIFVRLFIRLAFSYSYSNSLVLQLEVVHLGWTMFHLIKLRSWGKWTFWRFDLFYTQQCIFIHKHICYICLNIQSQTQVILRMLGQRKSARGIKTFMHARTCIMCVHTYVSKIYDHLKQVYCLNMCGQKRI